MPRPSSTPSLAPHPRCPSVRPFALNTWENSTPPAPGPDRHSLGSAPQGGWCPPHQALPPPPPTVCAPKPRGHCHTPDFTAAPAGKFRPFPSERTNQGPGGGARTPTPSCGGLWRTAKAREAHTFRAHAQGPAGRHSSLPRRRGGPPSASRGLLSAEALDLQGRALSDLTPEASPASCYHHSCRGFCLGGQTGALRVCPPPPPPSPSTGPAPNQGSESGHCSQEVTV